MTAHWCPLKIGVQIGDSMYRWGKRIVGNVGVRGDEMHVWMIVGGVIVAGAVVFTVAMLPDIVRYMKIKSM
jgi:hypothetical protein